MWTDIFFENKDFLNKTVNSFLKDINKFVINLNNDNRKEIYKLLKRQSKLEKSILKRESEN